jgi:uncharacterized protein (DUF2267 family)
MEYAEIIEAIGREAADLPPGRALDADAVAHLAQTFEPLVAEAQQRFLDIMPADEFWRRVGQRLGLDQTAARPVTEAVLETLAERVAADVVEDLVARLDPLLHPPLRRGIASSGPAARRIPLAALLRRVAGRESADVDEAGLVDVVFKHVQAVFATLAETVDAEEWFGLIAELPAEYSGLMPERSA